MEEQRQSILSQILEPAAKDRLKRLSLVKPDKARSVEDVLVRAATSGQLKSKVIIRFVSLFITSYPHLGVGRTTNNHTRRRWPCGEWREGTYSATEVRNGRRR
jgi:hypothetical protein